MLLEIILVLILVCCLCYLLCEAKSENFIGNYWRRRWYRPSYRSFYYPYYGWNRNYNPYWDYTHAGSYNYNPYYSWTDALHGNNPDCKAVCEDDDTCTAYTVRQNGSCIYSTKKNPKLFINDQHDTYLKRNPGNQDGQYKIEFNKSLRNKY